MSCAKTALVRHSESRANKDSIKITKEISATHKPITNMFASRSEPARVEIKTCALVVEKNLQISIADDMVKLIKSLFPGNETLQQVTLGKQKRTNVIRQLLGFYSTRHFWKN